MNQNQNFQIPQERLNQMLQMASQKLGTTPEELQRQLQNGNFDALKGNPMVNSVLKDPKKLQQMLNNPQIQQMLRGMSKQ